MDFSLIRVEFDYASKRAYVELRAPAEVGGGESTVTTIFSYQTVSQISKQEQR